MKSRRLLLYVTIVVGALLALGLYWRADDQAVAETASPPPATPSPTETGSPLATSVPVVPPLDISKPARALPPPGTINELAAKAGAGDAIAACQLAAELIQCRVDQTLRQQLRDAENIAAPRCEELLGQHLDRHFDLLRQAAHAGEPEAMLRYAMGEGFGLHGASFDYLRSPGFDTWRREAPAMLQSLLEAGYPEAVIYRMLANEPGLGGPMANLLQDDPVQDQAYSELFLLLNEESPLLEIMRTQVRSRANETVRVQAQQQAERWHQDHFRGQTFDFAALESETESGFPLMRAHGANCSVPVREATP